VRVSPGGLRDEAEIRGHRRTYIGALPGKIIQAIRKAGTRGCVMMLDEIDKVGAPAAAATRRRPCWKCWTRSRTTAFATTTWPCPMTCRRCCSLPPPTCSTRWPGPLRDRMEVLQLTGYTQDEKRDIARKYLVARQEEACGLAEWPAARSATRRSA